MSNLKKLLIFFCCLIFSAAYSNSSSLIDSLSNKLKHEENDSQKVKYLLGIAEIYNNRGTPREEALENIEEAIKISDKRNYYNGEVLAITDEALYYELKGNTEKELDCYLRAIDICDEHNLKVRKIRAYNNLSAFYRMVMKNNKKALEYSLKSLEFAKLYGAKYDEAVSLSRTGDIYFDENDFTQSLFYYLSAYPIMDSLKDLDGTATLANNIGSVYEGLNKHEEAIEYYNKALSIYQQMNNRDGIATALANLGNIYDNKGDMKQGIKYSLEALPIAKSLRDKDLVANIYSYLSEGYGKMGQYQKAFEYETDLKNLNDTLFNEANSKQMNDMMVKYDTEKKDRENKILELNINRQKIISYATTACLALVIALIFFVYRGYINKKKAHEELAVKNAIIEEKNKDILDSINYARTIQNTILTPDNYLKETLGEYFIIYKPRNVVSGDFYWCYANGNHVVFTVADCTGHGVPGAFMSMIGNSLLNEIVIENKITDAAQILNNLRTNLLKTLQQNGQNAISRDGMDIALCVWDKTKNTLQYAGAYNPLYLLRNGVDATLQPNERIKIYGTNLVEIMPDKQPIGFLENRVDNPFSSQLIQLQKGDVIYLSTDGFPDQFGGEKVKKYTRSKLRETFVSMGDAKLSEQKNRIDEIFENWKGATEQTDDVCLMGVKIS